MWWSWIGAIDWLICNSLRQCTSSLHKQGWATTHTWPQISSQHTKTHTTWGSPGHRLNIKSLSRYRDFNYVDKMVVRPSSLYNVNPYTGKTTSLYWEGPQGSCSWSGNMSHHQISVNLEMTRDVSRMIQLFSNLTGISTAVLPRHLSVLSSF